jgi:plasmid replication initiation protein
MNSDVSTEGLQARLELTQQELLFASLDELQQLPNPRAHKLLPNRHANRDFFLADLFDYAMKDDGASMEAPIFTLSTKPDLSTWNWESKDGDRKIEVFPSVKGRATQFDKDVLIFVVSQMTEALNRKREDAQNRTVRFVVHDYLVSTNKPTGGIEYKRLELALDRLRGTSIKTDIRTGGERVREGFGIIDSWTVIEKSKDDERMIAVEITLSKWLFNAVQAHEVLTIHKDYFRLRKPLERRLYELARKHCGQQSSWKIGMKLLREKCGAHSHLRAFKSQVIAIARSGTLPEYRLVYDQKSDQAWFHNKNPKKITGLIGQ